MTTASLFGISKSNRDFSDAYYWGKNQFNSSFPVALACYMKSKNLALNYITFNNERRTNVGEITVDMLYGSSLPSEDLFFSFETRFEDFRRFVHDEIPAIDLVVCLNDRDHQNQPVEVKLTTIPDNTTESLTDDCYGAELVIRAATTKYMALSMVSSIQQNLDEVRAIFEPSMGTIRVWDSKTEMAQAAPAIFQALIDFLNQFRHLEKPILMQPIWKTMGKTPVLAENCLDIFVWSDFALTHLFLDSARSSLNRPDISRHLRAALRLARFLYQASSGVRVHQAPIYDGMTYDNQNDKEFSISGTKTRPLMACARLTKPIITRDEIKKIILGGGQKHLSPERRFDAILFFSNELFEDTDQDTGEL